MPSDMQSAQGRGRSRDRTAERVGLTRHTTRGGSSRELEERYKCMRCTCMWKGSCSGSVRVAHDVPHAGGSPARWQPVAHAGGSRRKEASQSVSQSVGASRPRMRTQGRLQRGQPAAPRSPGGAQWHSCSNVGPKNGRAPSRVHTSVNGLSRCDPERPSRGLEPVGNVSPRSPYRYRPRPGHRTTSHEKSAFVW
jgi:hypothetical protein